MCDLCRLVSDDTEGGVFITSLPLCPAGRELVIARGITVDRLRLSSVQDEIQSSASPGDDGGVS